MDLVTKFEELIFGLAIVACCYYVVVRKRRKQWPVANALIQKGTMGQLDLGEAGTKPAAFMGYSFKANGLCYAYCFVLCGSEVRIKDLYRRLPGNPVQVRYDPSDPNTSFLVNCHDVLFEGLVASQASTFLAQAPAFDVRDAIG